MVEVTIYFRNVELTLNLTVCRFQYEYKLYYWNKCFKNDAITENRNRTAGAHLGPLAAWNYLELTSTF